MNSTARFCITALLTPLLFGQDAPQPTQGGAPEQNKTGGNEWFDFTQVELGTYFDEEDAVGSFRFKNPRDGEQNLSNIQPNCACTKAIIRVGERRYEIGADKLTYRVTTKDGVETKEQVKQINLASGEEGEIEVHMTMHGVRGRKDAAINLQTSDETLPLVNLRWSATGAQYFVVEPPDINLNEMSWGDKREFEFRITSPLKKDFNLTGHDPLSKGMRIEYEKEMQDDRAVWHVRGTYGPEVDERDSGGQIKFNTDVDGKTVTARVVALIKGPLSMEPGGFVSLGHIKQDEGKTAEIVITPNGDFDLQVEKLEVARLHGVKDADREAVEFKHEKDGKAIKVTIVVGSGINIGTYMNGLLRIHLNHPASRMKEVMFNGFVR